MPIFYEKVYKQKWYQKGLLIVLDEFCKEYLQVSILALMRCNERKPQEAQSLR
jgi:hypothetical protein